MKSKFYILLTMLLACTMQVKGELITGTSPKIVGSNASATSQSVLYPYDKNSGSQNLYLSSEIGQIGKILEISYYVSTYSSRNFTGRLKIYMAETDLTALTTTSHITSKDNMTLVYDSGDGNYTGPTSDGWETFQLTTPFLYGGRNLIVATEVTKSTWNTNLLYACSSSSLKDRSIIRHNDNNPDQSGNAFDENTFLSDGKTSYSFSTQNLPYTRFTFTDELKPVQVGQGTTGGNRLGYSSQFKYQAFQSIYTKDEIGTSGTIKKLAFQLHKVDNESVPTNSLKIYLAESDLTSMDVSTNKLSTSSMTKVFDGTVSQEGLGTNDWMDVSFDVPFDYSGTKNLVVAVSNSSSSSNSVGFLCYPATGRSVYTTSSSSPDEVSGIFNYVANARFSFDSEGFVYGTGTTVGNSSFGYSTYYAQNASQHLYLNTEVGKTGIINNLAFQVYNSASTELDHPVKIYMAEVAQTSLTAPLKTSDMTLVFDGTVKLGGKTKGDWIGADLTSPFLYTGTGSLVVAVSNTQSTAHTGHRFLTTSASYRSVYTSSSSDPDNATTTSGYLPNALFSFDLHGDCSSYTVNGFGKCPNCEVELKYEFRQPDVIYSGNYYGITNVGELMWLAKNVNNGSVNNIMRFYLCNDIDLTGYDWTPIGTDSKPMKSRLYGRTFNTTNGHTISGIPSTSSLVGTLSSSGYLLSLRQTSGSLVKNSVSGTIHQCLTLGNALVESGTASISNSYYLSSSSSSDTYARTEDQMKSGQVTYELNSYSGTYGSANWYQTIGSDNYPTVNSSSKNVYRYMLACPSTYSYTNDVNLKDAEHHSGSWENSICSNCNGQPTTFSEDIELKDGASYLRTVSAVMKGDAKLTYTRSFASKEALQWQQLYMPIAFEYTQEASEIFELAKIQGYGIAEDTNGDGVLTTLDTKKLIVANLEVGQTTEPNTPYLIRVKKGMIYSFLSSDGVLSPVEADKTLSFSTMKESFVVSGNYTQGYTKLSSEGKMAVADGTLYRVAASSYQFPAFRWAVKPTNKNGSTWSRSSVGIFAHYYKHQLIDNELNSYFQSLDEKADNLSYERTFVERQEHNWQAMFVPFDVEVTDSGDDVYPKYATFDKVVTEDGVDYIYVNKCKKGDVISANTPCLVCVDQAQTLTYDMKSVLLKSSRSIQAKTLTSSQATYRITGVYEPYSNAGSEWYAIAKSDGNFHPAGDGAVLPPYRFYMTLTPKSNASAAIRFAFRGLEDEMETGIAEVTREDEPGALYTLDGRKVEEESVRPGIYIKDGKKVSIQ